MGSIGRRPDGTVPLLVGAEVLDVREHLGSPIIGLLALSPTQVTDMGGDAGIDDCVVFPLMVVDTDAPQYEKAATLVQVFRAGTEGGVECLEGKSGLVDGAEGLVQA